MSIEVILTLSAFVMILGALIYLLVPPPKPADAGPAWFRPRIITMGIVTYGAGLLALLLAFGRKVLVD